MGFFDFLKKKDASASPAAKGAAPASFPVIVAADAKGAVMKMEAVPDPIFSQGVLGFCCGIEPVEGKVYAPIDGKVTQVADTNHAAGFAGPGGVEVLIHIGADTVDMEGDGFASMIKVGDTVTKGQLVLTMDLDKIRAAGHPATVITVVTNSDSYKSVELAAAGEVEVGDDLMRVNN